MIVPNTRAAKVKRGKKGRNKYLRVTPTGEVQLTLCTRRIALHAGAQKKTYLKKNRGKNAHQKFYNLVGAASRWHS